MRAADARKVLPPDAGSVRRWRPTTLPAVEVVECHQTPMAMEGIEEAYTLSLKTEVTVFPTELGACSRVLVLQPTFVSQIALQYCGRETGTHWRVFAAHAPSLGAEMLAIVEALPALSHLEATARLTHLIGALIAQFAEPVGGTKDDYAAPVGLGRARDLLHARSSEAVTLDDLVRAAECGTTRRLIRGFRAAFGFTPHQYLTHLRLQQARHLLRRGHDCGETAQEPSNYIRKKRS